MFKDFKVPSGLENDRFRLKMLSVNDAEKDYEAVMSSVEHLKGFFGPKSKCPAPDMTLEQGREINWETWQNIK